MAPSEHTSKSTGNQEQHTDEAANPFVAFKRLADQQISSLLNLAFGSNPLSSNPSAAAQQFKDDYEGWLKESRNSRTRLEREAEEAAGSMTQYQQDNRVKCPYRSPAEEKLSDEDTKDLCSFIDLMASGTFGARTSSEDCLPPSEPKVPLEYLLHSQYSPINLEKQKPFSERGTAWRAAFEDLLDLENGYGLSDNGGSRSNSAESPHQWIRSMLNLGFGKHERLMEQAREQYLENLARRFPCPGQEVRQNPDGQEQPVAANETDEDASLNEIAKAAISLLFGGTFATPRPSAKRVTPVTDYNDGDDDDEEAEEEEDDDDEDGDEGYGVGNNDDGEDEDEEETELDLYRRLLCPGEETRPAEYATKCRVLARLAKASIAHSEAHSSKPSILSTLTTTEKSTLPDGTTHTKVVLKKRFSDGREESTETVHTQNPVPEKLKQPPAETDRKLETSRTQKQKEKKGWFWS